MQVPPFNNQPSESDKVTYYDELHFVTYLRLLDADAAGADWREVVRVVFGLDPDQNERARQVYGSHLARARWMTEGLSAIARLAPDTIGKVVSNQ